MPNRLDSLENQGIFETTLLLMAGQCRIAEAILYLFYYYAEVNEMSKMVEFIIDLKDHFVPVFNESETLNVNKATNQNDEMFLTYDEEKILRVSESKTGVVIGKIKGKFREIDMLDVVGEKLS
jgi:hypothetical protein